ncbi:MAG: YcxB family protein [Phycisphaerales bacterium]
MGFDPDVVPQDRVLARVSFSATLDDMIAGYLSVERAKPVHQRISARIQWTGWGLIAILAFTVAAVEWAVLSCHRTLPPVLVPMLHLAALIHLILAICMFRLFVLPELRGPAGSVTAGSIRRMIRSGQATVFLGDITYTITDLSLVTQTRVETSVRSWHGGVLRVTFDDRSILIWIAANRALIIPVRVFQSPSDADAFHRACLGSWERHRRGVDPQLEALFSSRSIQCPACDYPLKGIQSPCCPECGLWLAPSMFNDLDADKSAPLG